MTFIPSKRLECTIFDSANTLPVDDCVLEGFPQEWGVSVHDTNRQFEKKLSPLIQNGYWKPVLLAGRNHHHPFPGKFMLHRLR